MGAISRILLVLSLRKLIVIQFLISWRQAMRDGGGRRSDGVEVELGVVGVAVVVEKQC